MDQQSNFEKLISHLKELILIYRALFTIALEKKEVIIKNNIEEVNKLTLRESKLLNKVTPNEDAIRQLIIALQRDLGFRPKLKMKLSELSAMLINHEEKQLINELLDELADIAGKLKDANTLNQQLVETALEYINFSIGIMTEDPNEDVTYRHPMLGPQKGYR